MVKCRQIGSVNSSLCRIIVSLILVSSNSVLSDSFSPVSSFAGLLQSINVIFMIMTIGIIAYCSLWMPYEATKGIGYGILQAIAQQHAIIKFTTYLQSSSLKLLKVASKRNLTFFFLCSACPCGNTGVILHVCSHQTLKQLNPKNIPTIVRSINTYRMQ